MNTAASVLRAAAERLAAVSDSPRTDAALLLTAAGGPDKLAQMTHPEAEIPEGTAAQMEALTARAAAGEPLPYILGEWEFYGMAFTVTPDVLIPRPETEGLAERAAAWIAARPEMPRYLDAGTGSGCIPLALLRQFPALRAAAVDISLPALRIAQANARRHGLGERFFPICSDWLSALDGTLDLVTANLPYIPSADCDGLAVARHEPRLALDGGADGFAPFRLLFEGLTSKISKRSLILCEIEYSQRNLALNEAARFFPEARICVEEDLAGLPRYLIIERNV